MDEASDVILTLNQEYQARDSNISKSFIGYDLDYNNYCLECKYISYYWHLLFVSGLGQCYDTTFAFNMVPGPADVPPEGRPDDHLVDQVGLLPLVQQK